MIWSLLLKRHYKKHGKPHYCYIIDAADPRVTENIAGVNSVLAEIEADEIPTLLVMNKIDLLDDLFRELIATKTICHQSLAFSPNRRRDPVALSSVDGTSFQVRSHTLNYVCRLRQVVYVAVFTSFRQLKKSG